MNITRILDRDDWVRFVASVDNPGLIDTSTNYRTQTAALNVLNQSRPDCVGEKEFETLKVRVQTNLNVTKGKLIDEFVETMKGLEVSNLNRDEISKG